MSDISIYHATHCPCAWCRVERDNATEAAKPDPDRQHICAELARCIWPEAEIAISPNSGVDVMIYDKSNETRSWHGFDPFTDAAASRALIAWLATDDKTWMKFASFLHEYCRNTVNEEWRVYINRQDKEISGMDMMQRFERAMMTASLETITLAAYRTIQP